MPTFLAPAFLWALLAIPVVILLHFIRVRRRRQTVAGLFLWQQATQLAQARRRFSPTWLLLLQILFVTLAALALARPVMTAAAAPERVLVIDATASMAAGDPEGVRVERALDEAYALLGETGRVAVVRAGLEPTVVQAPTDDHAAVRSALAGIEAADARTDLLRALELARTVMPDAQIHLFTDSEAPRAVPHVLHSVAGTGENVGITAFELRGQQAFVSLTGNNRRPLEVDLSILRGDVLVVRTSVLIGAGGQANVSLPVGNAPGTYRAEIVPPDGDALELDDVAYTANRSLRTLLVGESRALERALEAVPALDWRRAGALPANLAGTDVVVLVGRTGEALSTLPPGRYLVFAPRADDVRYERIADWDRANPLLRFVNLTETRVGVPAGGVPPLPGEEDEWTVLARSESLAPTFARRTTDTHDIVVANFHPAQSDIIHRTAFPLFVANVLDAFRGEARSPLGATLVGEGVLRNGEPFPGSRATLPGLYRSDDRVFTVSLLSAEQTRLPVPSGEPAPTPGAPDAVPVTERAQEIALILVALALAVLLLEWLVWSRSRTSWIAQR